MNRSTLMFIGKGLPAAFGLLLLLLLLNPLSGGSPRTLHQTIEALVWVSDILVSIPWQSWLGFAGMLLLLRVYIDRESILGKLRNKKMAQAMAGWGLWASANWGFDNALYPVVIAWKGLGLGGFIMTIAAALVNVACLLAYEYQKNKNNKDWLGMDSLREFKEQGYQRINSWGAYGRRGGVISFALQVVFFIPKSILKLALWMLNRGNVLAFVALSIFADSFVVTAYFRGGVSGRLTKKDWMIFLSSTILSNIYWSLRSFGVVLIIRYVWEFVW